ncbi:MAG: hypothetical protein LBC61_02940 [Candidatus Peribacteria bacterium]|nr:hypothetical protein [Candidatus Peribacteria bacterium]
MYNSKIFANKFKFIISIILVSSISSNFQNAPIQEFKIKQSNLIFSCSIFLVNSSKSAKFVKSMLKFSQFLEIQKIVFSHSKFSFKNFQSHLLVQVIRIVFPILFFYSFNSTFHNNSS